MKGKKKSKNILTGLAAVAATGLIIFSAGAKPVPVPTYQASRVIDGDTFVTKENQMIRIYGIDAPAINLCNGKESSAYLKQLILNKNIYLKVIYRDSSNRLISEVFTEDGPVSDQMVKSGMAFSLYSNYTDQTKKAMEFAAKNKLGIYSSDCLQEENKIKPNCVIKANLNRNTKTSLYRFPGCGQYNNTEVSLSFGDQWFCTEKEAQAAGFVKGSDCFDRTI